MTTFISYSRVDSEFAVRLAKDLKKARYSAWLDQLDIPTGARWDDEIERALEACTTFLIVLSPESIQSQNVKDEIGYAIDAGKQILPVVIENCKVPFRLRRFQYVDFSDQSYETSLARIKFLLGNFRGTEPNPTEGELHLQPVPELAPAKSLTGRKWNTQFLSVFILLAGLVVAAVFGLPQLLGPGESTPEPTLAPSEIVPEKATTDPTVVPTEATPEDSATALPEMPNAMWISYGTTVNESYDIFLLNPVTKEKKGIITGPPHDKVGAWSTDGKLLAFESNRDNGNYYQIYLFDSGQGRQTRLTEGDDCSSWSPAWSPDGEKIAFYSNCENKQRDIYIMNRDGTNPTRLTSKQGENQFPAFSPDGERIAFTSTRNGRHQILLMGINGNDQRVIADGCSATFSPDGNWLWFSNTCEDSDIKRVQIDGMNLSTVGTLFGQNPFLSADGQFVVFQSNNDIWIMRVDGSDPTQLTFESKSSSPFLKP